MLHIKLPEKFNQTYYSKFAEQYVGKLTGQPVELDFSHTIAIDSVGLGMLLVFRDACLKQDCPATLVNVSPEMLNILESVNFTRLFEIQPS